MFANLFMNLACFTLGWVAGKMLYNGACSTVKLVKRKRNERRNRIQQATDED